MPSSIITTLASILNVNLGPFEHPLRQGEFFLRLGGAKGGDTLFRLGQPSFEDKNVFR